MAPAFEELKAILLALHGQERYEEALLLLQEAVASRPEHRSRIEFWSACLECRLERPGAAMRRLQALVDAGGWVSPLRLTTDTDLFPLHGRSGWDGLVAACEARLASEQALVVPEVRFEPPEGSGAHPPTLVVALHMTGGNVEESLRAWAPVRGHGHALATPRGAELMGPGEFGWNELTGDAIGQLLAKLARRHDFDAARLIFGGASAGAAHAVSMAVSGAPHAAIGFVAIAGAPTVESLAPQLEGARARGVRGVFIVGENDYALPRVRAAYSLLAGAGLAVRLEVVPGAGHEYPRELPALLQTALEHVHA